MDFLGFVTAWFWYLMAFLAGALVAWLLVRRLVKARTPREAIDEAVAKRTGATPAGHDDDEFAADDDYDDFDDHDDDRRLHGRGDDTMPMEVQR